MIVTQFCKLYTYDPAIVDNYTLTKNVAITTFLFFTYLVIHKCAPAPNIKNAMTTKAEVTIATYQTTCQ